MKKGKKIPKGYATITDCFKMTGVGRCKLYRLIFQEKVKYKTPEQVGKYCINVKSLKDYIENSEDVKIGTWGSIDTDAAFFPIVGYDHMYCSSSDGSISNLSNGQKIKASPNPRGYLQVCFMRKGKRILKSLSHVIMQSQGQGKNTYNKKIIHHINKDYTDNRLINLLPVFEWQHQQLHKLIDLSDTEGYVKMVNQIAAENSEKLYKVSHPDFVSDKKNLYYLMVTQRGYDIYISGGEIPFTEVRMEICEPTSKKGDLSCD